MGTYAILPSRDVVTSWPVTPPSGISANCFPEIGSMMPRLLSPLLATSTRPIAAELWVSEWYEQRRVSKESAKKRTRESRILDSVLKRAVHFAQASRSALVLLVEANDNIISTW